MTFLTSPEPFTSMPSDDPHGVGGDVDALDLFGQRAPPVRADEGVHAASSTHGRVAEVFVALVVVHVVEGEVAPGDRREFQTMGSTDRSSHAEEYIVALLDRTTPLLRAISGVNSVRRWANTLTAAAGFASECERPTGPRSS